MHNVNIAKNVKGKSGAGFTLVEILVATGVIAILAVIVGQIYFFVIGQVTFYREQTVIANLANQHLEVARNLPYAQLGTIGGNPSGNLANQSNPIAATANGIPYQIYYSISFVDDPADGTVLGGNDATPSDYKQVKLYIRNTQTNQITSFLTNMVPEKDDGSITGGALFIQVFDAMGNPVQGATIQIQNTVVNPTINLTRTSDSSGNWIETGLPDSVNSYHVIVTKNGYSSEQTYPVSVANPNPVKSDATITQNQTTQISFSIDKVSNLTLRTLNQSCGVLPSVGISLRGSKFTSTSPLVYKFNNTYTSDNQGNIIFNNIEWDTYFPKATGSTYVIYGISPMPNINASPSLSTTYDLIMGPKPASKQSSILIIVKDASTLNPIGGASITLSQIGGSYGPKITGGGTISQQDWSGGSGQADFTNPTRYFSDNNSINTTTVPLGIRLSQSGGTYASDGELTSSTFDAGSDSVAYTTISWQPTHQDPQTSIKFQIASKTENQGNWNYKGPDGTGNSYYTISGSPINLTGGEGKRFLRYKAFLSTNNLSITPVLTSVSINYVNGCETPGQVIFSGLPPTTYQAVVSANGYQVKTMNQLVLGSGKHYTLEVLLNR